MIALWIAGRRRRRGRALAVLGRARPPGGAGVTRALRPARGGCAGAIDAAARQVDLAPRGAARRDGRRAGADPQLPRRRRHQRDARRRAGARRARRGAARRARWSAAPACAGRSETDGPIDVGNAGTLMRLLPGLARRPGGRARGRSTATRRSAAGRSTASPSRWRGWARRIEAREGPLPAVHRARRAPARRSSTSCRSPAPRSSRACCSPGSLADGDDGRGRAASAAATTPSGCSPARRRRPLAPRRATASRSAASTSSSSRTIDVPGRPVLGGVPRRRRRARAGLAPRGRSGVGVNWTRTGFLRDRSSAWARSSSATSRSRRRRASPSGAGLRPRRRARARSSARSSSPTRCRWRSTSCRSSRCSAASPRARRSCAAPQELRVKESDRIAARRRGRCAASAPRSRRPPDGFAVTRHRRAARRRRSTPHGDHRLAMLGAVAGLASREGVEVVGMEAAAVSYPGFAEDLGRCRSAEAADCPVRRAVRRTDHLACSRHGRRDRRARGRRQVHRRARGRRGARLHLPRLRRDVPLRRRSPPRGARRRRPPWPRGRRPSSSATACGSTART